MTAAIDITTGQRKILLELLRRFIPSVAVWAYGSRVKWTARPNSDLDLVAFTTPAQGHLVAELKEALAESDLPFLVDFHVWDEVPERFHEIIRKEYVALQEAKQPEHGSGRAGEWVMRKLRECCDFNPSSIKPDWPHRSLHYIDISSVGEGFQTEPPKLFLRSEAPSRAQRLVAPGDCLLSTVRPNRRSMLWLGSVADDVVASTGFAALRAKPGVIFPRFLYYIIFNQTFTDYLVTREKGAAYPAVSTADIGDAEIALPPLAEQEAIAHILGTLDDKIELNRRMNATLEAMARALFQSWFVDFDPVRAKLDGRKPAGLDDATAALFPAHFQDSPLGHIPQGWRAASLGNVIEISDSKRIPLSGREREKRQGQYPYYGAASVMDYVDDFLFDGIYVLMGEDGSVINEDGTPVLQYVWGKFWVNNHAHVLRGTNGICTEHLLLHLKNCNIAAFVTGAVQLKLNQGNMNRIEFILPPPEIGKAFAKIIEPLFAKIRANTEQSRTLAILRDALLPKLLSGELRVAKSLKQEEAVINEHY